ncbi:sodium- and chloride-dependent glycine transporter 1-like [Tachypleus tridentatus]|uniref:sodium- and chloride-dependent glycine transporter 1-like n=1 Tax=Tachypleus tridentatus TaxID=6853 RepID=UPI003FD37463
MDAKSLDMKNTSNQENELPPAYSDVIATITVPDKVKDHSEHRGQWGRSLEFLMSCISMSVGLGNVYVFPTLLTMVEGFPHSLSPVVVCDWSTAILHGTSAWTVQR